MGKLDEDFKNKILLKLRSQDIPEEERARLGNLLDEVLKLSDGGKDLALGTEGIEDRHKKAIKSLGKYLE